MTFDDWHLAILNFVLKIASLMILIDSASFLIPISIARSA